MVWFDYQAQIKCKAEHNPLAWRAGRFTYAYKNKYGKIIPEDVSEDLRN